LAVREHVSEKTIKNVAVTVKSGCLSETSEISERGVERVEAKSSK
jgi:hypothetical protein